MRHELPSGTVTFLFTDVEGSTKLLHELGADGYAAALAEHRRVVRQAFARHDGVEVDTQGDAFFVAFPTAPGALAAAREMTEALAAGPIRVRIGLHTGTPLLAEEGYVGADVNRAARIAASGHGGQVLVSSSTAALVSPSGSEPQASSLRDLGEHRLKDLSAPERIYQLGDGDFPPLATLHQTNLPVQTTPFLGREHELAEVVGLVSDGGRLLTLTGPGGSGKTRLALQAAGAVSARYPQGVWWVPLASLRDPALVLESASQVLGAKNGLAEHIADRRLLVLFDNFEHVVAAAGGLGELLAQCPGLELLVTSREPLHLRAEQTYAVPPFAPEEAVGFFAARARVVNPEFEIDEAVPGICRRLDDLPLALELAAARVKALSTRLILERLEQRLPLLTGGARDAPERQRTLRATIEWSYELLSEEEQRLFARLAVFRGGWTLEAAEAVCEAGVDALQSLVEKSLVRFSGERYWMLETIREFAEERLDLRSGEAVLLKRRHALHFLDVAEEAEPHLHRSKASVERLVAEQNNLRAALDYLQELRDAEVAVRLAAALPYFWYLTGQTGEGRSRLEATLRAHQGRDPLRAKALNGLSWMAVERGDSAFGRACAREALDLYRELEDDRGVAEALLELGSAIANDGDPVSAQQPLEESIRLFHELGDEENALLAKRNLAGVCHEAGDLARARRLHEENLARANVVDDARLEAMSLGQLAMITMDEGRVREALPLLEEQLRIWSSVGQLLPTAVALGRFARAFARMGDAERALRLLSAAERLLHDEMPSTTEIETIYRETRPEVESLIDGDRYARIRAEGRALTLEDAVALALDGSVEERDEA